MKRILLFLLSLTTTIVALADRGGFYYKRWTVEANVSADNVWTVHEVESVFFNEPRHGIYRYLPLDYYANLNAAPDGEEIKYEKKHYYCDVEVTNTEGAEVDLSTDDNDNLIVRFGSADYEVTGDMRYVVDYTYGYPDDRIRQRDFIFHTLKPADIQEEVSEFEFVVKFEQKLPDDIAQRLIIYTGAWGGQNLANNIENLVVTPTRISGTLHNVAPGEALTLYAELPEGFWQNVKVASPWPSRIACWLAIIMAIALLYYELFCGPKPADKSVEFYAPDGITPSEVGKIIDDTTDVIDLTVLVPWLAQHGYLEIREIKEKGFLRDTTDIELTKLRELPSSAPLYQQRIMEMLFPEGDKVQKMSELGKHPDKVQAATKAIDAYFTGERKLTEWRHMLLATGVLLCSWLAFSLSDAARVFSLWTAVLFGCVWLLPFCAALMFRLTKAPKDAFRTPTQRIANFVLRALAFAICLMATVVLASEGDMMLTETEALVMMALCYAACELSGRLVFDTPYRGSLKGRLMGFREFIDTAEKDRLKMLVDEDPEYFYKVLPYAMVFELSKKWVDLFKDIPLQEASWYHSSSPLTSYAYMSSLNDGISSRVNTAISTSGHTSSSSGGGFSGGGGGGGGGGSW